MKKNGSQKKLKISTLLGLIALCPPIPFLQAAETPCETYPTHQIRKTAQSLKLKFGHISASGSTGVALNQNSNALRIADFESGKIREIPLADPEPYVEATAISKNGAQVAYLLKSVSRRAPVIKVMRTSDGVEIGSHVIENLTQDFQMSPDGRWVISHNQNHYTLIDTQKNRIARTHPIPLGSRLVLGDQKIIVITRLGEVKSIDLESGLSSPIPTPVEANPPNQIDLGIRAKYQLSSDGSHLAFENTYGKVGLLNLKNGKIVIPSSVDVLNQGSFQFSPDGKKLFIHTWHTGPTPQKIADLTYDLETGEEKTITGTADLDLLESVATPWLSETENRFILDHGLMVAGKPTSVCVPKSWTNIPTTSQNTCQTPSDSASFFSSTEFCSEALTATLCGQPVDENSRKAWAPLTPSFPNVDLAQAKLLLLKFQKPGLFDPQQDLSPLLAILKSDLPKTEPDSVQRALQGVLHASTPLYRKILHDFPELAALPLEKPGTAANQCRTPAEQETLNKTAEAYLSTLLSEGYEQSFYDQWKSLAPLAGLLKNIPKGKKEEIKDLIAQGMTDQLLDDKRTPFLKSFESKIYHFAAASVARLFGQDVPAITDLTYQRMPNAIYPVILSTGTLQGKLPSVLDSRAGFNYSMLKPAEFSRQTPVEKEVLNTEVSWTVNGKNYHGKLTAKAAGSRDEILTTGPSPDYSSMWKDGMLTGLVLLGTNLSEEAGNRVSEYQHYLRTQGFRFLSEPRLIYDVKGFLQKKIETGELDYWIKEAHMGGEYDSIVALQEKGLLQEATRTDSRTGKKERIFIIYPEPNDKKSPQHLSNHELASWFKTREKTGLSQGGQMIMVSSSCESEVPTIRQIEAVQSNLFLPFPTISYTTGIFGQGKSYAQSPILDGIRQEKPYAWMRKELDVLTHPAKENESPPPLFGFVFPPEKDYQSHITQYLATPLEVNLSVTENGTPYHGSIEH